MDNTFSVSSLFQFCTNCLEGSQGPYIQAASIIAFVLVFNGAVRVLLKKLIAYLGTGPGKSSNRITAALKNPFAHLIWTSALIALLSPLSYLVWFIALLCSADIVFETTLGTNLNNMNLLMSVGAVAAFGWFLLRWNQTVMVKIKEMSCRNQVDITLTRIDLINKIASASAIFITVFLLLDVSGRNVHTLIAFGGVGGLALAIASQQVVSNFFSGLMIYLTRPFTVGERVSLPEKGIEGHIESIGWYLTLIRNLEKRPIYVPNSLFAQNIVITPSRKSHERFFHTILLRYEDIGAIKTIIEKINSLLINHPAVDHAHPFEVFFKGFGVSGLEIEISAYFSILADQRYNEFRQDLLLKIAAIIAEENARIALPLKLADLYQPAKG